MVLICFYRVGGRPTLIPLLIDCKLDGTFSKFTKYIILGGLDLHRFVRDMNRESTIKLQNM